MPTGARAGGPRPRLVALDWGTTSLRAWLLGDDGRVLEGRRRARGLQGTAADDSAVRTRAYQRVFAEAVGDWLRADPALPVLACGMVGSAQGWKDAGYRAVPCDLADRALDLVRVDHDDGVLHLVPGLRVMARGARPGDVMRGEETQLAGVLDLLPDAGDTRVVVLPGTHTKWVQLRAGTVASFTTAMSGELFAVLVRHSILALTAVDGRGDDEAFVAGLSTGTGPDRRGLAAELFGARALVLEGLLDPGSVPDYLSGVIIADEVQHQLDRIPDPGRIVLCGAADLCRRYDLALRAHGLETQAIGDEAAVRGLWTIATTSGLLTPHLPGSDPEV